MIGTKRPKGSRSPSSAAALLAGFLVSAVTVTGVGTPVAYGQTPAASGAPSAAKPQSPATPSPSTGATADSQPAAGNQGPAGTGGQPSGTGSGDPGTGGSATGGAGGVSAGAPGSGAPTNSQQKPQPVCFKLTGRCVENTTKPAHPKSGSASGAKSGAGTQKPLNLTAPDVRSVVPAEELKEPLPTNDQITEIQESETVQVQGDKDAPDVPGGFGALWWAVNHPSQAWRIFAPAQ